MVQVHIQLIIMRHGSTAENESGRYLGKTRDVPLSDKGRAQCLAAGVREDVTKVYASPLLRARQSAALCFPCAEIEVIEGLEEFDFGVFEGRSASEMVNDAAYRSWVDAYCIPACPGGDSRASFMDRSNAALTSLLEAAAQGGEEQVIVVAHGGTIMAACYAFAAEEEARDYFDWKADCACGYTMNVVLPGDEVRPIFSSIVPFSHLDF